MFRIGCNINKIKTVIFIPEKHEKYTGKYGEEYVTYRENVIRANYDSLHKKALELMIEKDTVVMLCYVDDVVNCIQNIPIFSHYSPVMFMDYFLHTKERDADILKAWRSVFTDEFVMNVQKKSNVDVLRFPEKMPEDPTFQQLNDFLNEREEAEYMITYMHDVSCIEEWLKLQATFREKSVYSDGKICVVINEKEWE